MRTASLSSVEAPAQTGHAGAKWRPVLSLSARLSLTVAVIVGAVVSLLTGLEVRTFERATEQDLLSGVTMTARAVADNLQTRPPSTADEIAEVLHDFMEANPAVRSLSVVSLDETGRPELVDSTSSVEAKEALDLARAALVARAPRMDRIGMLARAAEPLARSPRRTAVVATMSLSAVAQAANRGQTIALWFAVPTVVVVTLLLAGVMRWQVHHPLADIRSTMENVARGELGARAAVVGSDELGIIAEGLNDMLERLEHFNDALQERIREATEELRLRNVQIYESYQRTVALHEALTRAERMGAVGQVAATVAHQIGTPLNLISGYLQMLRAEVKTDARSVRRLEIVESQIQQVTRILRTLLDEARQPSPRQTVAVSAVIGRACEIADPRLRDSGVRLDLSLQDPLPPIVADPVQLELALLNLISNAMDAMPEGGTLTVRVFATGEHVRLEVSDTGHGIPAELLPRIFDPWVTTKPVGHGTGLGLGIVRQVVEAHGGTISARNGPQSGAIFTVDLPYAPSSMAA